MGRGAARQAGETCAAYPRGRSGHRHGTARRPGVLNSTRAAPARERRARYTAAPARAYSDPLNTASSSAPSVL
jgi:hypothetical protein